MATEIEFFKGNQIGGCVTVITCTRHGVTSRIMIDYGADLPGSKATDFEYSWAEKPVDALFLTHYHGDHAGRILQVPENVPIYMGNAAKEIMANIQRALCCISDEEAEQHKRELALLENQNRVHTFQWKNHRYEAVTDIPNFRIEPYSVDHSAYDAYMFLIEADDEVSSNGKKVILHTGDFRDHGYRGKALFPVVNEFVRDRGKRNVDILITEGTMMSRQTEKVMTEYDMQRAAADYLREHKYAFLICSSTNLDSLASFYQAAQKAAKPGYRYLYAYNLYACQQLKAFTEIAGANTPLYRFEHTDILAPWKVLPSDNRGTVRTQGELMREFGFLALIKPDDKCEKIINDFIDLKPVIIYSMWDGYLNPRQKGHIDQLIAFIERQKANGVEVKHLHTGGHASAKTLADLINAVDPKEAIYPIHTENAEGFRNLEIKEYLKGKIKTLP